MADWIVCPGCNLRHSARADGLCPRCRQGASASTSAPAAFAPPAPAPASPAFAYAVPSAAATAPAWSGAAEASWPAPAAAPGTDAPPADAPVAPLAPGARIAGALLVLLAASNLAASPAGEGRGGALVGPAVVDLLVGGALALGLRQRGLVGFAIFRAAAGGLVFGAYWWLTQGAFVAAVQLAMSTGFLLLLVGRAGTGRLVAGAVLAVLMLAVNALGTAAALGGANPLADLAAGTQGYGAVVSEVEGAAIPWRLELPAGHWRLRSDDAAHRDNPSVDRMLGWPAKDAAIVIVAERVDEGQTIPLGALTEVVVANAQKGLHAFEVKSREPLPSALPAAALVHATAEADGTPVEALYGVFVDGNVAIQVMGIAPRARFHEVEPELRRIIASLRR